MLNSGVEILTELSPAKSWGVEEEEEETVLTGAETVLLELEMAVWTAELIWGCNWDRMVLIRADWSIAGAAGLGAGLGATGALATASTSVCPARGPVHGPAMFSER